MEKRKKKTVNDLVFEILMHTAIGQFFYVGIINNVFFVVFLGCQFQSITGTLINTYQILNTKNKSQIDFNCNSIFNQNKLLKMVSFRSEKLFDFVPTFHFLLRRANFFKIQMVKWGEPTKKPELLHMIMRKRKTSYCFKCNWMCVQKKKMLAVF